MKPTPSDLAEMRYSGEEKFLKILKCNDPGFETVLNYAVRQPLLRMVGVRVPMTPPQELERLIEGISDEMWERVGL